MNERIKEEINKPGESQSLMSIQETPGHVWVTESES
jgi:hypothetical protein